MLRATTCLHRRPCQSRFFASALMKMNPLAAMIPKPQRFSLGWCAKHQAKALGHSGRVFIPCGGPPGPWGVQNDTSYLMVSLAISMVRVLNGANERSFRVALCYNAAWSLSSIGGLYWGAIGRSCAGA